MSPDLRLRLWFVGFLGWLILVCGILGFSFSVLFNEPLVSTPFPGSRATPYTLPTRDRWPDTPVPTVPSGFVGVGANPTPAFVREGLFTMLSERGCYPTPDYSDREAMVHYLTSKNGGCP